MTRRLDIAALRLNTEMTGELKAVQIQSVSAWPKVAFKGLKSHETKIDPENHEVTYSLVFKPKSKLDLSDFKVMKILEESIWALLGDTWRMNIEVKGVRKYHGARRQEIAIHDPAEFGPGRSRFDPQRADSLSEVHGKLQAAPRPKHGG